MSGYHPCRCVVFRAKVLTLMCLPVPDWFGEPLVMKLWVSCSDCGRAELESRKKFENQESETIPLESFRRDLLGECGSLTRSIRHDKTTSSMLSLL